jgi:hypothetical protein
MGYAERIATDDHLVSEVIARESRAAWHANAWNYRNQANEDRRQ